MIHILILRHYSQVGFSLCDLSHHSTGCCKTFTPPPGSTLRSNDFTKYFIPNWSPQKTTSMSAIRLNIVYYIIKKSCTVYQDVIDSIMSDIQGVAKPLRPLYNLNYQWYHKCILHGSIEVVELYETVYIKKKFKSSFWGKKF